MVRIKICGITRKKDALYAVKLGVDALGFVFAPSPRKIHPDTALGIIQVLPPFVQTVGVFMDEDPSKVRAVMARCGLDIVQFHGKESPQMCKEFMPRVIKAFSIASSEDLEAILPYKGKVRAVILDSSSGSKGGGSGNTFDWTLACKAKRMGIPIILAGGINPSNVEKAIGLVRPFGVDVSSGVERGFGEKDPFLLQKFVTRVRRSEDETSLLE